MHICLVSKSNEISKQNITEYGHLLSTSRHLVKLGHKITIINWKSSLSEKTYEEDSIKIYFLGVGHYKSVQEFPEMAMNLILEISEEIPIDVVHSFDTSFKNFRQKTKKKKIALSYGVECTSMMSVFSKFAETYTSDLKALSKLVKTSSWFLRKYFFEDYKLLKQADAIFVTSPKQALALERYYLYPSLHTYQIPLSLALGYFPIKQKKTEIMQELDLDYNSQIIVARDDFQDLSESKFLLEAFEKVAIRKPRAKLLVIGDGPEFKKAELACLQLALDSKVIFLGKITKKKYLDYVNLGDIFIQLTARSSGLGVSLLEAMSQEKIVIGSAFSPIANFITHDLNGFLIRPGEKEALTNMIIDIFEKPKKHKDLGLEARKKIIETLDRKSLALSAANAFQEISTYRQRKFW